MTDDLASLPTLGHFHYLPETGAGELFGLTSWFRPSIREPKPSGVTFRNLAPAWVFGWVPIYEMGHYWGLNSQPGHAWA